MHVQDKECSSRKAQICDQCPAAILGRRLSWSFRVSSSELKQVTQRFRTCAGGMESAAAVAFSYMKQNPGGTASPPSALRGL